MNDHEAVMEVFTADLPESVRVLNCGAVTEEIIYGRDGSGDDLPAHIYDRFRTALDEMVDEGILRTGEYVTEKVYGLTLGWQDRYREQAMTYLRNLLTLTERQKTEAEDKGGGGVPYGHRANIIAELLRELEN